MRCSFIGLADAYGSGVERPLETLVYDDYILELNFPVETMVSMLPGRSFYTEIAMTRQVVLMIDSKPS